MHQIQLGVPCVCASEQEPAALHVFKRSLLAALPGEGASAASAPLAWVCMFGLAMSCVALVAVLLLCGQRTAPDKVTTVKREPMTAQLTAMLTPEAVADPRANTMELSAALNSPSGKLAATTEYALPLPPGFDPTIDPRVVHFSKSQSDNLHPVHVGKPHIEGLTQALDTLWRQKQLFMGKYEVLPPGERRVGGQGVVQFVFYNSNRKEYAVKFFLQRSTFDTESALYRNTALRDMMPLIKDVVGNEDAALHMPNGYVFPPFIVAERGQSLEDWLIDADPMFFTLMDALTHVAHRLHLLHSAGWAHRDLKPGNVLRLPAAHEWTLLDFGCAAKLGTTASLSMSLCYAAPETIQAYEGGAKTVEVSSSLDIWALGVICVELLTRTPTFDMTKSRQQIRDALAGRTKLPWEDPDKKAEVFHDLRGLKRSVLQCLERDPAKRPSAMELVQKWEQMFDATSGKSHQRRKSSFSLSPSVPGPLATPQGSVGSSAPTSARSAIAKGLGAIARAVSVPLPNPGETMVSAGKGSSSTPGQL